MCSVFARAFISFILARKYSIMRCYGSFFHIIGTMYTMMWLNCWKFCFDFHTHTHTPIDPLCVLKIIYRAKRRIDQSRFHSKKIISYVDSPVSVVKWKNCFLFCKQKVRCINYITILPNFSFRQQFSSARIVCFHQFNLNFKSKQIAIFTFSSFFTM